MGAVGLENVWKSFGRVEALKGVDLQFESGGLTVLLGHSGAGKTTILRMIAGLENRRPGSYPNQRSSGQRRTAPIERHLDGLRELRSLPAIVRLREYDLFVYGVCWIQTDADGGGPQQGTCNGRASGDRPAAGSSPAPAFRRAAAACGVGPNPRPRRRRPLAGRADCAFGRKTATSTPGRVEALAAGPGCNDCVDDAGSIGSNVHRAIRWP